jgi:UDP-glucose 4-epimerase
MKYIVTGGAGFIGSHLVEKLLSFGHDVVIVDDLSAGTVDNIENAVDCEMMTQRFQSVDVEKIGEVDGIFHLAAQASVPLSIEKFYFSSENNLLSTIKVFDIAKQYKIPVVYASSSAIYGDLPLGDDAIPAFDLGSPYAVDKLVSEHFALVANKLFSVSSIGLRFFNIYGPRQDPSSPYSGVISIFSDRVSSGESVTVNGGHQTRDFVFVKDAVDLLYKSMQLSTDRKICETVNVCTGRSISINNLLEVIIALIGKKPQVVYKELPPGDPERSLGTYQKMLDLFGLTLDDFIQIEEGLAETVKFYQLDNS